jgi:malonyl-CoA O-methyltransferase
MNLLPPEYINRHQVAESYDRAAPIYQQWARVQKTVEDDLLERLGWLKMAPEQILDVGAGIGRLSGILSQKYQSASVYSIDISIKMLQTTPESLSSDFLNQHRICADAAYLPIADDSIDLLVSNLMLQWCADIDAVFAEFARVLKPDGALFFTTFGPDTLTELRHSWASVDNDTHLNPFVDMHDLGDALLQVGLTNPVMDVDWLQFSYTDVKQLLKELKAIGSHNITAGRPCGLIGKRKFQAMLAAYEQYRSAEGELPATYEVIYGHALGKQERLAAEPGMVAIPISQIGRPNRHSKTK